MRVMGTGSGPGFQFRALSLNFLHPLGRKTSHPVVVKSELDKYLLMAGDSQGMEPGHRKAEPSQKLKP